MRKGTALWLLAMIATAIPCAGGPRVAEPANDLPTASELTRIEAIVPAVTSEMTRVVIHAGAPMLYTSYEPDRTRLVIEIRDAFGDLADTATNTVTVELVGGAGALLGQLEVEAVGGIATFTDIRFDSSDSILVRFTAPGLAATGIVIVVVLQPAG